MKRFLSILIISCGMIAGLSSCHEDDDFPTQNNYYYVKYETYIDSYQYNVYVNTDRGKKIYMDVSGNWSGIYGPVSKGFYAKISTSTTAHTQISVSKNDGPFAIKATGRNGASYTIDF